MDTILQSRKCTFCETGFDIYEKDRGMLDMLSPTFAGKKYLFPNPTECPDCRRKKRLVWRNESKLFRRKCDLTGASILSFYDETVKHPVYERDAWFGDGWSPLSYGRDFDFTRPFFDQFLELKNVVPHFSRSILQSENADFSNNANDLKNCYLCFNGGEAEDCYHCTMFHKIEDSIDCYNLNSSSECYECVDCFNCQKVFYSYNSTDCFGSFFLKNCIGCKNCFMCKNCQNVQYQIFNVQYSEADYLIKKTELLQTHSQEELEKMFEAFCNTLPEKYMHGVQNQNVVGEYINNCKDVFLSYEIIESENIRYCTNIKAGSKNLIDVDIFGWSLENSYEGCVIGHDANRMFFSFDCWDHVDNIFYSSTCTTNTKNCFGCVGLKGQEYCIFNKQYTKENYEITVAKIIEHMISTGEWGQFFPKHLSSFAYNESVAVEYYPLEKNEVIRQGFVWTDYEAPFPKVEKYIPASMLPSDIKKIPDDVLNWAIECEDTKKPFRLTAQELEYYRKHSFSVPKKHPDIRYRARLILRNPRNLFQKKCDKCGIEIQTTYSTERLEKVYCESCYNKQVY